MRTGLALDRLCRVTLEPSSVYKKHKIYAYWLHDFYISLHWFTFDDPMRTNRQKHCSLWLCRAIGVLIHGLTNKYDTVVEFDSDRCFFLLWLPNFRKFCMSKHSCSYVIIVPWNNIQKRLLLSFYAEKALASLYICTGSPESSSWYWNIMCWLK